MVGIRTVRMVGLVVGLAIVGCGGGGGGGSSEASYAGTWRVEAGLVSNGCNIQTPQVVTATLEVNQNGNAVLANSNNRVFDGLVINNDGFFVGTIINEPNGCQTSLVYEFVDASDGEANVTVYFIASCGPKECRIDFRGIGRRISNRLAENGDAGATGATTSTDELFNSLAEGIATTGGVPAQGTLEEGFATLAEESLSAP